jgi:hypothetical protein
MGEASQPSQKKNGCGKVESFHTPRVVVENKPCFTKPGEDVVGNENI